MCDCGPVRPPAYYTTMDPEWADLMYGFPYPPFNREPYTASDGSQWVYNALGNEEWDMMNYPPSGDPYMKVKERVRRAATN